jgi:hypothetical protein
MMRAVFSALLTCWAAAALAQEAAPPVASAASPGKILAVGLRVDGDGRPEYHIERNQ